MILDVLLFDFICVCGCMCEGQRAERREARKENIEKGEGRSEKRGEKTEKREKTESREATTICTYIYV